MSLSARFNNTSDALNGPATSKNKPAPFSLRLTETERTRLLAEAKGAPLGAYIKARALGSAVPMQMRRSGLAVEDRQALAKALALLGNSRLASNLNQLAQAANFGALIVTPETEGELREACAVVREMRALLVMALGLKTEVQA